VLVLTSELGFFLSGRVNKVPLLQDTVGGHFAKVVGEYGEREAWVSSLPPSLCISVLLVLEDEVEKKEIALTSVV
jgi:hypothetical protein